MSLFSKFFKKSKLNQEVLCLVNLQDSIIMPPNSFFDNVKNKELCEQYYQEYKRILSNKKTFLYFILCFFYKQIPFSVLLSLFCLFLFCRIY